MKFWVFFFIPHFEGVYPFPNPYIRDMTAFPKEWGVSEMQPKLSKNYSADKFWKSGNHCTSLADFAIIAIELVTVAIRCWMLNNDHIIQDVHDHRCNFNTLLFPQAQIRDNLHCRPETGFWYSMVVLLDISQLRTESSNSWFHSACIEQDKPKVTINT